MQSLARGLTDCCLHVRRAARRTLTMPSLGENRQIAIVDSGGPTGWWNDWAPTFCPLGNASCRVAVSIRHVRTQQLRAARCLPRARVPWSAHTKALMQTRRPVKPRIIRLSSTRLHPSIPPAPTHSPTRCSRTRLAGGTTSDATGSVAPPGFCNRGEVRYGSIGGLDSTKSPLHPTGVA